MSEFSHEIIAQSYAPLIFIAENKNDPCGSLSTLWFCDSLHLSDSYYYNKIIF